MALVKYITNYKMVYNINENGEKLCALIQKNETNYLIYKQICELAQNSFDVEIDADENGKLVENLNKKSVN